MWGINETKFSGGIGGYIIAFCTILTIVGGLTEDNLGTTKYLAAYCFTIGLFGSIGTIENLEETVVQNEERSCN
jgi:hypothetical protein